MTTLGIGLMLTNSDCVGCLDTLPAKRLTDLPCQHRYCTPCLHRMAHIAMTSEHLFPARCCSVEVPLGLVLSALDARGKKQYSMKKREYAVPPTQRWHCPSKDCGSWIPPKYLAERVKSLKCPICKTKICTTCRKSSHEDGQNCADDPDYIALLHLARARKWQQCPRCRNMVESLDGCLEVHCRCNMILWFVVLHLARLPTNNSPVTNVETRGSHALVSVLV